MSKFTFMKVTGFEVKSGMKAENAGMAVFVKSFSVLDDPFSKT